MFRFYALLCCLSIVGCVLAGNVANLRGSSGNASTAVNSAVSQISSETSSLTQAGVASDMGKQLGSSPLPVVLGPVLPPVVPGLTPEVRLPPVVVPAVVPSIVRNLPVPSLPLAPLIVPLTALQANATTAQYGVAVDNKTDLSSSWSASDWAHAGEQYADDGEHVGEQYAHFGEDYAHRLSSETMVSIVPVPVVRVPPLVAQLAAYQSNASVQEDVLVHNATDLESSWWGSEWAHVGEQYAHYGEHMGQQYAHEGEGYRHFGEHIGEQYAHVGEDYARHYAR